jgi:hypothetical protein
MSHTIAGTAGDFNPAIATSITVPSDGDALNVASVESDGTAPKTGFQYLINAIELFRQYAARINNANTFTAAQTFNGVNGDGNPALQFTGAVTTRKLWGYLTPNGVTAASALFIRSDSGFEIVTNAGWDGSTWACLDTTKDAGIFRCTVGGALLHSFQFQRHTATAQTWGDTVAGGTSITTWTSLLLLPGTGGLLGLDDGSITISASAITRYLGELTQGVGVAFIPKAAKDVASGGAATQLLSYTVLTSGVYRVSAVVSAHTNDDTVIVNCTYTDAPMATNVTEIIIPSAALTHDSSNGTVSGSLIVRASTATALVINLSTTSQTTTRASAIVERLY